MYNAVKFLLLDSMDEKHLTEAGREIRNQWRCNHANVASIKWVNLIKHKCKFQPKEQMFLCIAMEFCSNGELFNSVAGGKFATEAEKRRIFSELVAAVEYLHTFLEICHRDLKLENVLLDGNNRIKYVRQLRRRGPLHARGPRPGDADTWRRALVRTRTRQGL